MPLTIANSVTISHGVTVRSALHWLEDTNVDVFQHQDNSEKEQLVVSQTFDLNFLPLQGHKNHFSTGHFLHEIPRSFQIRSQK